MLSVVDTVLNEKKNNFKVIVIAAAVIVGVGAILWYTMTNAGKPTEADVKAIFESEIQQLNNSFRFKEYSGTLLGLTDFKILNGQSGVSNGIRFYKLQVQFAVECIDDYPKYKHGDLFFGCQKGKKYRELTTRWVEYQKTDKGWLPVR